jgi:hypothetical protein
MRKGPCLRGKSRLGYDSTGLADSLQAGGHWLEPSTAHRRRIACSCQAFSLPKLVRRFVECVTAARVGEFRKQKMHE